MKLSDFYSARAVADNWTEVYSNEIPYLGPSLFTPRKKAGLSVSWLKGSKGLPVSLMPSAFDAKPTFRDRIGVSKVETELCFFRESMLVKEKDEQDIMEIENKAADDPYVQDILRRIFDDTGTLRDGAMVVPERMAFQLLAPASGDAKIHIAANGVVYDYNYDPQGTWKTKNYSALTGDALWSAPTTATPLTDFRTVTRKALSQNGTRLTTALMSQATFDYLLENAQIKSAILAQNSTATIFLDDNMLATFIRMKSGLTLVVYEKLYKDESGTSTAFYPDGYVTFLPDGPIGTMWYGVTPEERSARQAGNQLAVFNTGIALTVNYTHEAPYQTITTASEVLAPSYERMDEVYVLKVA